MELISWLYAAALTLLAAYGFNMVFLSLLALLTGRWQPRVLPLPARPAHPQDWPAVLVQLPLYNERYVAELLIDAVAALDYPPERLTLQVLDDSTDDTTAIARARVAFHHARGCPISLLHRSDRTGFKAGALAAGLEAAPQAELVAVFDADFKPPPDFLRRVVPIFAGQPRLALAQTRWEHLNADTDAVTRAQALALDGYFGVEQVARSDGGLLMNFNGSAGVWRRAAIEAAGGWQGDTLAEDLDLSYRAQLAGWRLTYLPDVAAPAELPTTVMAFKRQQFRWAKGSFQVLRKLGWRLVTSRQSPFRKLEGLLHLAGYLPHPLMVVTLLLSLPLVLWHHGASPARWSVLGLAGFGPPLLVVLGQLMLRKDWPRRLVYYPVLVLLGIGLACANTRALWEAFFGSSSVFLRTPKGAAGGSGYALSVDWSTWAETFLAFYALVTGLLALELAPGMAPFVFLYALGFGYTAALGFWQSDPLRQRRSKSAETAR